MTDYATLSDAELNRRIAEVLGYRVYLKLVGTTATDGDYDIGFNPGYVMVNEHGALVHTVPDGRPYGYATEDQAWERVVPRWSNDVGAAMFLLKDLPYKLYHDPEEEPEFRHTVIIAPANPRALRSQALGESLPRTICIAWLAWKEGQSES